MSERTRDFDLAVADGSFDQAWDLARRLGRFDLGRALDLTLLLGHRRDPHLDAAARRFLARFVIESDPSLSEVMRVADALGTVQRVGDRPAMSDGATRALEHLASRLRSR